MIYTTMLRSVAALAVAGALTLAGCGGGGGGSISPLPSNNNSSTGGSSSGTTLPATVAGAPAGYLTFQVPTQTSGVTAQSTKRAILSSARKPTYIDTTTANSAIVVSVSPFDPSEAAQYGTLTVCYNLYTGGTLAAQSAPNFQYTTSAPNVVATVTIAIPAPPGTDSFQITQYAGQCGSTPYTIPTPPPGSLSTNGILVQTAAVLAYMQPGVANNLNNQIANCPAQTNPCPLGPGAGGVPITASIAIASIAFGGNGNSTSGALPIAAPVREQSAFLTLPGQIGVPIPLEALNAAGTIVGGATTHAAPTGGSGPFPAGVTVTWSDNSAHTSMYLVDATTGLIAQKAASNTAGLVIHEFNALQNNDIMNGTTAVLDNNCGSSGTASCSDMTYAGAGNDAANVDAGNPWVIVLTFDGTDASIISSITVTATATINSATQTVTTTITPQSAVWSTGALGSGYVDTAAPAAALNVLQQGANVFFTDGANVKIDGSATVTTAGVTTKAAGLAYGQWPAPTGPTGTFIYATDSGQASGTTVAESGSGVYSWTTALGATRAPVAAQAGSGHYLQFNKPLGACEAAGSDGAYYLYVEDSSGNLYQLDIGNAGATDVAGNQLATNTQQVVTTGTLSPGTSATFVGTAPVAGTGAAGCLFADPGNNRIALVNTSVSPATITTYASGAAFTGIYLSGTAVYATSTTGQIYYISGSGATAVSFGLATGTAADGPVGPISSLTPSANLSLTPTAYGLQGAGGSFFSAATTFAAVTGAAYSALAAPYTVVPFSAAPFNAKFAFDAAVNANVGLQNDTTTAGVKGAVQATGGLIVFPATTAKTTVVTPDSILFADTSGKLRTLVR